MHQSDWPNAEREVFYGAAVPSLLLAWPQDCWLTHERVIPATTSVEAHHVVILAAVIEQLFGQMTQNFVADKHIIQQLRNRLTPLKPLEPFQAPRGHEERACSLNEMRSPATRPRIKPTQS
jgi:hypothetical protein